jgi:hypothetical protein
MKISSVVMALALIAAPLAAQGGPGRRGPAMGRGMMQGGPEAMMRNPATMVLEHRAELNLTDDQVQALESIQDEIQKQNGPRWEQLKAAFGDVDPAEMTVEQRQELRQKMQELAPVREEIRQTNRTLMAGFHETLTTEQQHTLQELMSRGRAGGPGAPGRGMRAGPRADRQVGAAWRSGFQAGMRRGAAACRMGGAGPGPGPVGPAGQGG